MTMTNGNNNGGDEENVRNEWEGRGDEYTQSQPSWQLREEEQQKKWKLFVCSQ